MVGCPRSGTTLAQSMITSHSKVVSCPETRILSLTIPIFKWRQLFKIYSQKDMKTLNQQMKICGYTGSELQIPQRFIFSTKKWTQLVLNAMDILGKNLSNKGEEIFLEKTPRHLHFVDLISSEEPESKYIHILRDGLEVVASMEKATSMNTDVWSKRNTDKCIFWWNRSIKLSQRYTNKDNHFFLTYSSLINDKETTVRKLCQFLEIDFEDSMINDYAATAQNLIFEHEEWKKNNTKKNIVKKKPCDFYSIDQIKQIKEALVVCDVDSMAS